MLILSFSLTSVLESSLYWFQWLQSRPAGQLCSESAATYTPACLFLCLFSWRHPSYAGISTFPFFLIPHLAGAHVQVSIREII